MVVHSGCASGILKAEVGLVLAIPHDISAGGLGVTERAIVLGWQSA